MDKISGKKLGSKVVVKIGRKTFSRPTTSEEYQELKANIEAYGKKPSAKLATTITRFMTPKAAAKQGEKSKVIKTVKTAVKKEKQESKAKVRLVEDVAQRLASGKVSQEEVNELESLIVKAKEAKTEAPVQTQVTTRRGEY